MTEFNEGGAVRCSIASSLELPLRLRNEHANPTRHKTHHSSTRVYWQSRTAALGSVRRYSFNFGGTADKGETNDSVVFYTTLNGGSLGSWIDEERSKVR